jgi:hypothetical protein
MIEAGIECDGCMPTEDLLTLVRAAKPRYVKRTLLDKQIAVQTTALSFLVRAIAIHHSNAHSMATHETSQK